MITMTAHDCDEEPGMTAEECIHEIALNGAHDEAGSTDSKAKDGATRERMLRIRKNLAKMKAEDDAAELQKKFAYRLKMYSHEDVVERLNATDHKKDFESLRDLLRALQTGRSWRELTPQTNAYNAILNGLGKQYPHFKDVIDRLRARMRFNTLKPHPVVDLGTNILLLGSPGCGKSSFLYDLGSALGTKFMSISCASMSMAGDLSGLSASWSTGHYGAVFDILVQQGCANPIMMLDEIDKMQTEGSHLFMSALYGLLEKNNARAYKDEYAGIPIDASRINWFASANDISSLNAPILDRFEIIHVSDPTEDDLRQIIPQLYEKQVHAHGLHEVYSRDLPTDVIDAMLRHDASIRRYKALIDSAMANASVRLGKKSELLALRPEDVPVDKLRQEKEWKIGFIH